jgi:hypothetical protein
MYDAPLLVSIMDGFAMLSFRQSAFPVADGQFVYEYE